MFQRRFLCSLLLASVACVPANAWSEDRAVQLSARALGLTYHFIDVREDAPFYPRKLDRNAVWVVDPGLSLSLDLPLPIAWLPYLRVTAAGYSDCAAQPAGYAGVLGMFPDASSRYVSFRGGVGVGIAARRNWARYVIPNHQSETFSDWGATEGTYGVYGELELAAHPANKHWEFVVNVIPGYPALTLVSTGVRIPLAR